MISICLTIKVHVKQKNKVCNICFRSDLAYFDGLHETIVSVGLVKPKAGVFKPYIEHLLCLTTTSEIVLLGVSFSQPSDGK